MGNYIHFSKFRIGKNHFSCEVKSSKRETMDTLEFSLSPKVPSIDRDSIACALATLCGREYQEITMDLAVSKDCYNQLKEFTQADLKVKVRKYFGLEKLPLFSKANRTSDKYILNFSGGFDSLAAMALLPPEKRVLVSIDFGGWFQREEEFFKEFHPYTLKTNFRQLKYDRASWTFMGTGAMLFAHPLNAEYHIFGTILEASAVHFRKSAPETGEVRTLPFSAAGLKDIRLMNGLSEVTTAMIMTKFYPELVNKSLKSLAAPTSEKRYRKQALTEIVCERYHRDIPLVECPAPDPKQIQPFGKNLALDFLAIYELKHRGIELVSRTVSDIPEEAVRLAEELNLEFYEHLNTKYLPSIPESLRSYYLARLEECGVMPYTEKDWTEFNIVRDFLGQYHPAILQ